MSKCENLISNILVIKLAQNVLKRSGFLHPRFTEERIDNQHKVKCAHSPSSQINNGFNQYYSVMFSFIFGTFQSICTDVSISLDLEIFIDPLELFQCELKHFSAIRNLNTNLI